MTMRLHCSYLLKEAMKFRTSVFTSHLWETSTQLLKFEIRISFSKRPTIKSIPWVTHQSFWVFSMIGFLHVGHGTIPSSSLAFFLPLREQTHCRASSPLHARAQGRNTTFLLSSPGSAPSSLGARGLSWASSGTELQICTATHQYRCCRLWLPAGQDPHCSTGFETSLWSSCTGGLKGKVCPHTHPSKMALLSFCLSD